MRIISAMLRDASRLQRSVTGAASFLVFAAAIAVRVYHITDPLLEFHATRQYRSAMIARAVSALRHIHAALGARDRGDGRRAGGPRAADHRTPHLCMATASQGASICGSGV